MQVTNKKGIIAAIEIVKALAILCINKCKKDDVVVVTVSGRGDKDIET